MSRGRCELPVILISAAKCLRARLRPPWSLPFCDAIFVPLRIRTLLRRRVAARRPWCAPQSYSAHGLSLTKCARPGSISGHSSTVAVESRLSGEQHFHSNWTYLSFRDKITNKHKQLLGSVPRMGGGQIFMCCPSLGRKGNTYHLSQNYYITAPYFWTINFGRHNVIITSQKSSWNYFWVP